LREAAEIGCGEIEDRLQARVVFMGSTGIRELVSLPLDAVERIEIRGATPIVRPRNRDGPSIGHGLVMIED